MDILLPTGKPASIETAVRADIASGALAPGQRLPLRTELEARFACSPVTVQKAMGALLRDGFIRSRGSLGTFVTENPPCLRRYGIVFPHAPHDARWGGYYDALRQVGHELGATPECEFAFYFGVEREGDGDYETLLGDVQAERLAGLFFANGPWSLQTTPVVQQHRVPCTAMMSQSQAEGMPHVATICLDRSSVFEAAINTLAAKGVRRPAVLLGACNDEQVGYVQHALATHGLPYDRALLQAAPLQYVELAEHVTTLWMALPDARRPDGLFVADDNLVEWACSGLLHADVHPGVDLPVAAYGNFPARAGTAMPLDWVGFDIRTLVQTFIDITNARRRNEPFEMHTTLTAVHEDALETRATGVHVAQMTDMAGIMV